MQTFKTFINESSEIAKEDLVPGFTFFVVSKDGRSLSKYKVTGEKELNVGTVLEVKHTVIAGDKFKQDVIAKDYVLGSKGELKVFKKKAAAMKAFKLNEAEKGDFIEKRRGKWYIYDSNQNIIGGPFKDEAKAKAEFKRL
jgi:hypothetical protein